MTRTESSGTETAWTSGQAAARRKALTDAGMERPVAEVLVDLLDEQATPMLTRAEADVRFAAMLDRLDAQRARERGEMEARFGSIEGRLGSIEGQMTGLAGQIAGLSGQLSTLKWTFGSIMAFNALLLGVLTYTVAT